MRKVFVSTIITAAFGAMAVIGATAVSGLGDRNAPSTEAGFGWDSVPSPSPSASPTPSPTP